MGGEGLLSAVASAGPRLGGATDGGRVELSVIVPVHNGAAMLARCLTALSRSDFRDYECIVVDDASSDDTAAVAARFPATLITLKQHSGAAQARNRGAACARGAILVFMDCDVCVHTDTLHRLHEDLTRDPETVAVFGSYDDAPADRHFVSQYKNLFHHYVHHRSRRDAWTFWAGCGAIRRDVFSQMGGFDESYTRPGVEDIDLGLRLHADARRIGLNPDIQVTHLKRWTVPSLVRADLFDRAIPWLLLMLRHRIIRDDLNFTVHDRASSALVWMIVFAIAAALLMATPPLVPLAVLLGGCVACLCALNRDLYAFFIRKRRVTFAARALPLHWLYLWYCGLAVPVALALHTWRISGLRKPVAEEDA